MTAFGLLPVSAPPLRRRAGVYCIIPRPRIGCQWCLSNRRGVAEVGVGAIADPARALLGGRGAAEVGVGAIADSGRAVLGVLDVRRGSGLSCEREDRPRCEDGCQRLHCASLLCSLRSLHAMTQRRRPQRIGKYRGTEASADPRFMQWSYGASQCPAPQRPAGARAAERIHIDRQWNVDHPDRDRALSLRARPRRAADRAESGSSRTTYLHAVSLLFIVDAVMPFGTRTGWSYARLAGPVASAGAAESKP